MTSSEVSRHPLAPLRDQRLLRLSVTPRRIAGDRPSCAARHVTYFRPSVPRHLGDQRSVSSSIAVERADPLDASIGSSFARVVEASSCRVEA